jgi:hypothetical protein
MTYPRFDIYTFSNGPWPRPKEGQLVRFHEQVFEYRELKPLKAEGESVPEPAMIAVPRQTGGAGRFIDCKRKRMK